MLQAPKCGFYETQYKNYRNILAVSIFCWIALGIAFLSSGCASNTERINSASIARWEVVNACSSSYRLNEQTVKGQEKAIEDLKKIASINTKSLTGGTVEPSDLISYINAGLNMIAMSQTEALNQRNLRRCVLQHKCGDYPGSVECKDFNVNNGRYYPDSSYADYIDKYVSEWRLPNRY